MKKSMRVQYINDPAFQIKYALSTFLIGATCFLFAGFVYYLGTVRMIEERVPPDQSRFLATDVLKPALLFGRLDVLIPICVLLTFLFFLGIVATHRFAGPLFAIKRHLDWVKSGRRAGPIRLRASDELQDLADSLNTFLVFMDQKDKEATSSLSKIRADLEAGNTTQALHELQALQVLFKRE